MPLKYPAGDAKYCVSTMYTIKQFILLHIIFILLNLPPKIILRNHE